MALTQPGLLVSRQTTPASQLALPLHDSRLSRAQDTKRKFNLGGLLLIAGFLDADETSIITRLERIRDEVIGVVPLDALIAAGRKAMDVQAIRRSTPIEPHEGSLRARNRRLIQLGGMVVKVGLQDVNRRALLGALCLSGRTSLVADVDLDRHAASRSGTEGQS